MHTGRLTFPARNDVHVNVIDRLPGHSTIELRDLNPVRLQFVHDDPRQALHGRHHRAQDGGLDLEDISRLGGFGDDQDMAARLRKEIQEGQHIGVFVNLVARRIAAKDQRKDVLRIVMTVETHDHSLNGFREVDGLLVRDLAQSRGNVLSRAA
ncbi:hypothetical protein D3C84_912320 [compost metagenome]